MYCSNCGRKLGDGENFCQACGKPVGGPGYTAYAVQYAPGNINPVRTDTKKRNLIIISSLVVLLVLVGVFVSMSNSGLKHNIIGVWVSAQSASVKIQFNSDGTCLLISGSENVNGTYNIVSDKMVTVLYGTSGSQTNIRFSVVDKNTISTTGVGTNAYTFKKLK